MITIDYTITDIEYNEDGTKCMLWLTRPFGPLDAESTKELKIGDEMSIQIQFPSDIESAPTPDDRQVEMFPELEENGV